MWPMCTLFVVFTCFCTDNIDLNLNKRSTGLSLFPLEMGVTLRLNIFESSLIKDALSSVWLKLVLWFWRRRLVNFVNIF